MEETQGLLKINAVGSLGPGDRLLVLLHGFGADENDLAPLVQHIDPDGRFTSVCLRAPIDLEPFGAAWYERIEEMPGREKGRSKRPDDGGFDTIFQ